MLNIMYVHFYVNELQTLLVFVTESVIRRSGRGFQAVLFNMGEY